MDSVQLGQDTTFSNNEDGAGGDNGYTWTKGAVDVWRDRIHTEAQNYGINTARAWGWSGNPFLVEGSGEESADIVAETGYWGIMLSTGPSCNYSLTYRVRNITDNYVLGSTQVDTLNVQAWAVDVLVDSTRPAISVDLEAGKVYRPEVEMTVAADGFGFTGSSIDFGQKVDGGNLFTDQKWFEIIF